MKAYLLTYNAACGAAWLFCVAQAALLLIVGNNVQTIYDSIGPVLMTAQTAMLLEIVHSAIGLVPSPVVTVAIQVMSRIFIVWGHLYWVPQCQAHWSLLLITFSWGITEVVRYAFYFTNLLGHVPYPIFYLRYSMFMVLYPTGITGEILQALVGMAAYWKTANPFWYRLSLVILTLYLPGSPGMIGNMWSNRKRSFQKRETPKEEPRGVNWPKTKKGDRSSTITNRSILAKAAKAGPGGDAASRAVETEKNWRFGYNRHLIDHVRQNLESPDAALKMANAGLDAVQDSFQFIRSGFPEMSMKDVMEKITTPGFDTAEQAGEGEAQKREELSLFYGAHAGKPYYLFEQQRNTRITGLKLREQLDKWVAYGTMEPDVADALKTLQGKQNEWLDLSGMYFALLGAASAMGPLYFLLEHGATVAAVARSKALVGILKKAKSMPGKVIFPVKQGADWKGLLERRDYNGLAKVCGCDLMTETPEIATWLTEVAPGKALTVGNYTYLDGALHVQIATACDCIMAKVCANRPKKTSLAFLGTPTDAHVCTEEAVTAANAAYAKAPTWMKMWEAIGVLKRNKPITVDNLHFMDAIVSDQGPNYILSKRIQHWRAMVARSTGHIVSSNVSPSTATSSVTSNASFAAAYGGMHIFRPMEVAYQELSLSLMGALLIHDLRNPASAANPDTKLENPLCLFQATSFHGGIWRCPYTISTIGIPSAIQYYLTIYWFYVVFGIGVSASLVQYTFTGGLPGPFSWLSGLGGAGVLRQAAEVLQVPL